MTAAVADREPAALRFDDERASHPLLRYAARRVASGVVTLLVVSVLVFLATSVLPGDAAGAILGRNATQEQLDRVRGQMGLDRPLLAQYWSWLSGLLRGDLGNSAAGYAAGGHIGVWTQISGKLGNSATLAVTAFVPIVALAVLLGVVAALRKGRWLDHLINALTLVPAAVPEFVLGAVLLAVGFSWLDVVPPVSLIPPGESPWMHVDLLVLPVLTLVGVTVGPAARMIRAGMIEALESEAVTVARLNGIPERRVVFRYALRNALATSIPVFALVAQYLVGGLLIVEFLFDYPGIGKELVDAVRIHDNSEVQSVTMLLAAIYVLTMIVADILVIVAVPRLRTAQR